MQHNKVECRLVLKRIYDAPVERLWKAWTDPAHSGGVHRLSRWLSISTYENPCNWYYWHHPCISSPMLLGRLEGRLDSADRETNLAAEQSQPQIYGSSIVADKD